MNNEEQVNNLISNNLRLVPFVFSKLVLKLPEWVRHEEDDFLACGDIGLYKAAQTFNESQQAFSTYAVACIRNEMLIYYRKNHKHHQGITSLDMVLPDCDDLCVGDLVEDTKLIEQQNNNERLDYLYIHLMPTIIKLKPLQLQIITLLLDGEKQSVIADKVGVSKQYVSIIRRNLRRKLINAKYNKTVRQDVKCPLRSQFETFSEYLMAYKNYMQRK